MSNCNKLFLDFIEVITLRKEERDKMKNSRKNLEKKISDAYQEKSQMTVTFYTQGSSAKNMGTLIKKSDGTYDADRGVYLPEKPDVSAETVQKYLYDAVKDHTDDGAEHRKKCIRVFYKGAYNIDFPVYYEVPQESYSYIAIKGDGWIKDDPSKMVDWFAGKKDKNGQLIRVVKSLKAWASERDHKMPSGIALTVWAAKNFVAVADRDDESLAKTIAAIYNDIYFFVSCNAPVEPFDDLVSKMDQNQKEKFRSSLKSFADAAQDALNEPNQLKSSRIWRKYLGERFPLGADENIDERANALSAQAATVLGGLAKLDPGGKINGLNGVEHLPHRNYGK